MTFFHTEQRRSERIARELTIHVSGIDLNGHEFHFPSKTLVLSRYGARIVFQREPAPEQEVLIYCPATGGMASARVAGHAVKDGEGFLCGVEFLEPDVNMWNERFGVPPGLTA